MVLDRQCAVEAGNGRAQQERPNLGGRTHFASQEMSGEQNSDVDFTR